MRGSDLIGCPVIGAGGRELGRVIDVRLVQDGPLMGAYAALRIESLVVGHHRLAAHLGYDRAGTRGPWLVNAVVDLITRGNRELPWQDARLEDGVVRTDRSELELLQEI
jgi:sporulation protein YlmC with PRC-barrel domain